MVESVCVWKVLAVVLFSAILPHELASLGFDDNVDVESWISKRYLVETDPRDYDNVRRLIMGMPITAEEAEMLTRRSNSPSITSRSRVELGPGMFKSPILRYPPKYFQNKLKHLIKLQNRQNERNKSAPEKIN